MFRSDLLRTLALMLVAHLPLASCAAASGDASPAAKPNVIVILIDDLGYGETGAQGNPEIPTPHLDALAAQGVRCTQGYVTASYCSPSRAGLLTGRYQTRFGHENNAVGENNFHPLAGLPADEITLAERLRSAGYRTALVGKWHLGATDASHPMEQGFDEFFGFLHEGHFFVPPPYDGVTSFLRRKQLPEGHTGRYRDGNVVYSDHMGHDEPPYDHKNPIMRGKTPVEETTYFTDALTREALGFIERSADDPFFLYLSYSAVHSPLQGADAYMERVSDIDDLHRRVFAAMLSNLDDSIGEVVRALRSHGLMDNTLIFTLSDNGGPTKELTSSNAPLRGGKGTLYEGGIRVPFFITWEGTLPGGAVYNEPVVSVDIYPTALAAAGITPTDDRVTDGVDLVPYLTGERSGAPHEVIYWRMGNRRALRKGPWKIIDNPGWRQESQGFALYHLGRDVAETTDLSATHPARLAELREAWRRLDRQMVPPRWPPRDR